MWCVATVRAGRGSETGHGRGEGGGVGRRGKWVTRGWCLEWRREQGANDRAEQAITAMGFDAAAVDSHALLERYGIQVDRLSDCSVCHR